MYMYMRMYMYVHIALQFSNPLRIHMVEGMSVQCVVPISDLVVRHHGCTLMTYIYLVNRASLLPWKDAAPSEFMTIRVTHMKHPVLYEQ